MKDLKLVEQLKLLKTQRAGGSPDERWLASTRETLLMQIRNTVGEKNEQKGFRALIEGIRLFLPAQFGQAIAIPLAVVFLMLGAGAGASFAVSSAQKTLPGDALYSVKLLAERASVSVAGRTGKTERRLEIAGRRLDEMLRLAASTDGKKEEKIAKVSAMFSATMLSIRKDLAALQTDRDAAVAVRTALLVDAKADEYQKLFKSGAYIGRPTFRLALLSLDQVSVDALEVLVEKQSSSPDVLPEAQLTSNVGKRIETFADHVAVTENRLIADKTSAPTSLLLTAKAREAVEEAKTLLSQGDFKAAVRKVSEGASFVTEAESAKTTEETAAGSASSTGEVDQNATSTSVEP